MKNPFEIIAYLLSHQGLTATEKRQMRQTLLSYVTSHPVKTGILSPAAFRFASIAFASLLIVLGGSVGLTSASMRSLPNQSLYPLKLWVEEFQSNRKLDPVEKIAFETKRIATRFDETAQLATTQSLDESTARMIQSGIEHSQSKIKMLASALETTKPALALEAASNLEATLSSSGKLLARIEETSGQNVQTIVLAAEVSTKQLALEKVSLEKLVALQPNELTKEVVLNRYEELQKLVAPTSALSITSGEPVHEGDLMIEIEAKIEAQKYSEALVLIKKVDQLLQEAATTKKLEDAYDIPALPEPIPVPNPLPTEDEIIADPNSVEILVPAKGTLQPVTSPLNLIPYKEVNNPSPLSEKTILKKTV